MAPERAITIVHFNDVYNIEASPREPVGGAARFVGKIKELAPLNPLVLFSGDAFNPSLMSTITMGKQMVPVLNAAGVKAACLGNHDIDFGLDNFQKLRQACSFPWLIANVLDAATGLPLGGCEPYTVIEHQGVRVGVMGLAERDWVDTLPCVDPDDVTYIDFVSEGARLAALLRQQERADLVVALTHMREPNDLKLAAEVEGVDMVLGGHDHFYSVRPAPPHGTLVAKSGTDFRELTVVTVSLPSPGHASGDAPAGDASGNRPRPRPKYSWERVVVDSATAEDPEVKAVVEEFAGVMGGRMENVIGRSAVELDGRFMTVRRRESNLGNFLCDVLRRACSADVVILNSGTFRSDVIHPAGDITFRDLVTILPMLDETVVIEPTGEQLVAALENGVSQWPALEGRFPQVSGIKFAFDPARPPGSRVVEGSVFVGGQPIEPQRCYKVATKVFLYEGKDGFESLTSAPLLVDSEDCIMLNTAARDYFVMLDVLNRLRSASGGVGVASNDGGAHSAAGARSGGAGEGAGGGAAGGAAGRAAAAHSIARFAARWKHRVAADDHIAAPGGQAESSQAGPRQDAQHVGHCVLDEKGKYAIAPAVEGRIVCTRPLEE